MNYCHLKPTAARTASTTDVGGRFIYWKLAIFVHVAYVTKFFIKKFT